MGPPSQLAIATSAVNRLVKEEKSYREELKHQEASIAKLEQGGGDENAEYTLRQEVSVRNAYRFIVIQFILSIYTFLHMHSFMC